MFCTYSVISCDLPEKGRFLQCMTFTAVTMFRLCSFVAGGESPFSAVFLFVSLTAAKIVSFGRR